MKVNINSLEFEVPLISLLLLMIIAIFYFKKKNNLNVENRIYQYMLVASIIYAILDTVVHLICAMYSFDKINTVFFNFMNYSNRILMALLVSITLGILSYVIVISYSKLNFKKYLYKPIIALLIYIILINFVDVELIKIGSVTNATGPMVTITYVFISIILSLASIIAVKNYNKNDKRFRVLYQILIIVITLAVVTYLFPGIIIYDLACALLCLVMYFTIENPDLKLIAELNLAKIAAEKANLAKSDFLSSMSHEIRTPLNAIVGLSQDMIDQEDLPDKFKEDANDIVNASNTLLEIVGNIIDISKIESNKMESIELDYSIHEIVDSVVKLNRTRIGEKDLKLTVTYAKDLPYELHGDKYHLKQVINNLVSNAIKYTEKGHVKIHVKCINKQHNSLLIISVEDTGKGIKKENINRLFDKFDRLDVEKNTTIEGVGLGLAITKRLVNLLGGKINVQSSFGYGSLFVVNVNQSISKLNKPKNETIVAEEIEEKNLLKNKKILIVDDNTLNIKVAKRAIEPLEMIIDTCESGKEAIILNIKNKYDIILMDIMMPGMSGEETLEKLKESENFNIPVIALTADAISGSKKKYINKGFASYIAKPFTKEIIKIEIEKILRRK